MRYSGLIAIFISCLVFSSLSFASGLLGVFQGKIVKSSSLDSKAHEKWVYVESRSGAIRKVNIAQALVEYDDDVPAKQRRKNPAESLRLATEVRVTAEQDRTSDGSGDWQAKRVLILARKLKLPTKQPLRLAQQ